MNEYYDVIIVGTGAAGLYCALMLYRIVGCAEIGDAHQSRDAKFGSAFAVDVFGVIIVYTGLEYWKCG